MLASLVLAVCINGQLSKDMTFNCAVEQFVQNVAPQSLPNWWTKKIAALGNGKYKERRAAYDAIVIKCIVKPDEARFVYWGLRHPDIEVRLWCNKVLLRISECPLCLSTGQHEYVPSDVVTVGVEEPYAICKICMRFHEGSKGAGCEKCGGRKRFWNYGVKEEDYD